MAHNKLVHNLSKSAPTSYNPKQLKRKYEFNSIRDAIQYI